ncbi:MAG: zinc ABC transporter substrate-binding protein [Pseudomonadota bacterium]
MLYYHMEIPMRLSAAVLAALLPLALPAAAESPRVATDIAPVQSLVARVLDGVGADAMPAVIVRPGASPHGYAMRPSEARALEKADLVVWMGPGLTPWLGDPIETLAPEAAHLSLLTAPETLILPGRIDPRFGAHDHDHDDHKDHDHAAGHDDHDDHKDHDHETGHDDHKDHDHAAGHDDHDDHKDHDHETGHDDHDDHKDHDHEAGHDDHDDHKDHDHEAGHDDHAAHDHAEAHDHAHAGPDPHAWLDPQNAAIWLDLIARELSALDPGNADLYAANAAAGQAELAALSEEIAARLAPLADRPFLVFHDAYQYFENRFGVAAAGALSLSDASDPGPARLAELRALAQEQGAACVFAEPQFNTSVIASVFGDAVPVGVLDPIGVDLEPGAGLYPAMLRNMAGAMAECLTPEG